jgi:hypothetical protein
VISALVSMAFWFHEKNCMYSLALGVGWMEKKKECLVLSATGGAGHVSGTNLSFSSYFRFLVSCFGSSCHSTRAACFVAFSVY